MTRFYKVMLVLLMTLPVGAYAVGAQVGAPSGGSPQTRLVHATRARQSADPPAAPSARRRTVRVPAHSAAATRHPGADGDRTDHHEHSDERAADEHGEERSDGHGGDGESGSQSDGWSDGHDHGGEHDHGGDDR